ncbi:MAG: TetR/AcrR family transcriptional regulator [Proteobacteria bacterium]|nr:TetR/AcrR family transcriptional regulator [Pseudomonadota bacterium]
MNISAVKPPGSTKARLLAITERLMSARGYEGVAIKDIAAKAGLRPAAIFHHFPTKADLVAAALAASVENLRGFLGAIEAETEDPRARIARLVSLFGETKSAQGEFCFAGVLAASSNELPEGVLAGVDRFRSVFAGWVATQFRATRPQDPERDMEAGPARVGEAVLALAEGALLVARMSGDRDSYGRTVSLLLPPLLAAP